MISCQLHDYVEIACLYRLRLRLKLKGGLSYEGVATDVQLNASGQECLLLIDQVNTPQAIVLTDLKWMQAADSNPHFDCVEF